jgi:hypothetical protein
MELSRSQATFFLARHTPPVNASSNEPSPVSEAMIWVSRILAVTAVMVLPGLAGQWLDKRFATSFLGIAGFVLGLISGMAYLLVITKQPTSGSGKGPAHKNPADKNPADNGYTDERSGDNSPEDSKD